MIKIIVTDFCPPWVQSADDIIAVLRITSGLDGTGIVLRNVSGLGGRLLTDLNQWQYYVYDNVAQQI